VVLPRLLLKKGDQLLKRKRTKQKKQAAAKLNRRNAVPGEHRKKTGEGKNAFMRRLRSMEDPPGSSNFVAPITEDEINQGWTRNVQA